MIRLSLKGLIDYYVTRFIKSPPKILSITDTIEIAKTKSICRFGDGEFTLMLTDKSIKFQDNNPELKKRLFEILSSNNKEICVCIPDIYSSLSKFTIRSREFWFKIIKRYRLITMSFLSHDKTYGTAFISRPYMIFKDKSNCDNIFRDLRSLWDQKDIVIVEGEFSRLGVGNGLFDNAKSTIRILTKCENAFDCYDELLSSCSQMDKTKLFILAIGPTATVLSYELCQKGYHALDLGHIDIEYEWFLKGAKVPTSIDNKSNNETGSNFAESSDDKYYLSQIVQRIGINSNN
ncbi:GT-D fold domain-containing glycosyltransferase [Prolixibacteraceae bacterium]|nr:GT-D fold domain-containing glycosyltransferase [Prolixibacteraceae bacterium]